MTPGDRRSTVVQGWVRGFTEALTLAVPGVTVGSGASDAAAVARLPGSGWKWWVQELSIAPGPAIWVGASAESWKVLEDAVGKGGDRELEPPAPLEAFRTLLTQAAHAMAAGWIGGASEQPVSTEPGDDPGPEKGFELAVSIGLPDHPNDIQVLVIFNEDLFEEPQGAAVPVAPEAVGMLQLPVHVTLGRTTLPLRDICKLTVGSVIEFRRLVTDPVDVMVKDALIARGQVVVSAGNYGVKIQAIEANQIRNVK